MNSQSPQPDSPRPQRGLSTAEHPDGYTHFYWNGHDVTGHWMWFFSGLRLKEEKYCAWIYSRRHGKELNKEFPYDTAR